MAERLNGYDESFAGWGMEDEDFKKRAEFLGYLCINSQLISVHLEHQVNHKDRLLQQNNNICIKNSRDVISQPEWGLTCNSEEIC
jgi:predicted glycosyltransferase involved in capsule biosynthesis